MEITNTILNCNSILSNSFPIQLPPLYVVIVANYIFIYFVAINSCAFLVAQW